MNWARDPPTSTLLPGCRLPPCAARVNRQGSTRAPVRDPRLLSSACALIGSNTTVSVIVTCFRHGSVIIKCYILLRYTRSLRKYQRHSADIFSALQLLRCAIIGPRSSPSSCVRDGGTTSNLLRRGAVVHVCVFVLGWCKLKARASLNTKPHNERFAVWATRR